MDKLVVVGEVGAGIGGGRSGGRAHQDNEYNDPRQEHEGSTEVQGATRELEKRAATGKRLVGLFDGRDGFGVGCLPCWRFLSMGKRRANILGRNRRGIGW